MYWIRYIQKELYFKASTIKHIPLSLICYHMLVFWKCWKCFWEFGNFCKIDLMHSRFATCMFRYKHSLFRSSFYHLTQAHDYKLSDIKKLHGILKLAHLLMETILMNYVGFYKINFKKYLPNMYFSGWILFSSISWSKLWRIIYFIWWIMYWAKKGF